MKHHDSFRPIGKCKGCCLNLKIACAAGLEPKAQWNHGRCNHYGKEEVVASAYKPVLTGAKLSRAKRRARALELTAVPHLKGGVRPDILVTLAQKR